MVLRKLLNKYKIIGLLAFIILLTSCGNDLIKGSNDEITLVDNYVDSLESNVKHIYEKSSDTSSNCYSLFNDKLIGWKNYYNRGLLYKKMLYVNDSLANYSIFYDEDGRIIYKKGIIFSPIENRQVLSEYLDYGNSSKTFALSLNVPDTIYTDLNAKFEINFKLFGGAKNFNKIIIVTGTISNFFGDNLQYLFKNKRLNSDNLDFRINQYGIIKLKFELKNQRKATIFMEKYLFVFPKKYKNYDWSFLQMHTPHYSTTTEAH